MKKSSTKRLIWAKQALYNDLHDFYRLAVRRAKRFHPHTWVIIGFVIFSLIASAISSGIAASSRAKDSQVKILRLNKALQDTKQLKAESDVQLRQKAASEAEKQKEIDALRKQVKAKQESQLASQQAPVVIKQAIKINPSSYQAAPPISGCSIYHTGNSTIDTLINRESGGRTCVTNGGGCYGILQACPGSPLRIACGGDGACQLAWFTVNKLSSSTYHGSWAAALAHSYAYGWW